MPGILDLKTNLKSLKYGNDKPGGDSSGQPYIQKAIPEDRPPVFDDGLIRGGALGALGHSLEDTLRVSKFLTDFPRGPLFLAKQVGLQLSNPAIETKKIQIGNGQGILGFIGNTLSDLSNTLGPTRIYNLGLNTLAQIPVNAFGGHFNRHGLLPIQDENTKYEAVVKYNNEQGQNRLVNLTTRLINPVQSQTGLNIFNGALGVANTALNIVNGVFGTSVPAVQPQQLNINQYIGGPDSVYGVGTTTIRRYDFTNNATNKYKPTEKGQINYYNLLGVSRQYFTTVPDIDPNRPTKKPDDLDNVTYNNTHIENIKVGDKKVYSDIKLPANYQTLQNIINSKKLREKNYITGSTELNQFGIIDAQGNYVSTPQDNIGYVNSDNKVILLKTNGSWNSISREQRVGSGKTDKINLTPLFSDTTPPGTRVSINGQYHNVRDLIKFRIEAIRTDNPLDSVWMIFRAYLKSIQDNYSPEWGSIKYAGRGEKFNIYNGFNRQVSFTFKVAALSKEEMKPMYQKLNFLASNTMPDYDNNLMRGPMIRLTLGNYLYRETAIINSLSYTIADDAPWEIALDEPENGADVQMYELPHIIDVSITCTILHNNLPQKDASSPYIANKGTKGSNPWLDEIKNPLPEGKQ